MHRVLILCLALAAGFAAAGAALAQDDVVRELQRKAKANEQDNGYCASVAASLQRLEREQVPARLNQLLSRADGEGAALLFASGGKGPEPIMCFYFVFQPASPRDGKKCRDSAIFGCVGGRDCRTRADNPICEKSPGVWD